MRRFYAQVWLPVLAAMVLTGNADADGKQRAALELAEYAIQRFGRGVVSASKKTSSSVVVGYVPGMRKFKKPFLFSRIPG